MSFRCAACGEAKLEGILVIRETRKKIYEETQLEHGKEVSVQVGAGEEIVREERICKDCQMRENRKDKK